MKHVSQLQFSMYYRNNARQSFILFGCAQTLLKMLEWHRPLSRRQKSLLSPQNIDPLSGFICSSILCIFFVFVRGQTLHVLFPLPNFYLCLHSSYAMLDSRIVSHYSTLILTNQDTAMSKSFLCLAQKKQPKKAP